MFLPHLDRLIRLSLLLLLLVSAFACAPSDPAPDAPAAPGDAAATTTPDPAAAAAPTSEAVAEMLVGPDGFEASAANFDPAKVEIGAVLYQMILNGQPLGTTAVEIRQEKDVLDVREVASVPDAGFLQQTSARFDTASKTMQSIRSQGQLGAGVGVDVDLKWQDGRLSGHSDFPRQEGYPQGKVGFDHELDGSILERTIIVHLIGGYDLAVGAEIPLRVFNAYEGRVRGRTVRVTAEEEVTVPAGTFQTVRVEIDGGEPSHVLWVAVDPPHRVVKMELLGQPWVYEMIPPPEPGSEQGAAAESTSEAAASEG